MINNIIGNLRFLAKDLNLLIVEDEKELSNELNMFLKNFFKNIEIANNGEEALALYKNSNFDIVISDLNMPNMNGVELSRELKIIDKNQSIIILSGYLDKHAIELVDIGIDALIIKPYVLENFLGKIVEQCEKIALKKINNEI